MLVTRLLEDALIRWEHEGKISAQTFPSKGQEAIAIGCCAALKKGDTVIPSFRTRGAMIGMGVSIAEQFASLSTVRLPRVIRAMRRITAPGRIAASCRDQQ